MIVLFAVSPKLQCIKDLVNPFYPQLWYEHWIGVMMMGWSSLFCYIYTVQERLNYGKKILYQNSKRSKGFHWYNNATVCALHRSRRPKQVSSPMHPSQRYHVGKPWAWMYLKTRQAQGHWPIVSGISDRVTWLLEHPFAIWQCFHARCRHALPSPFFER